MLSLILALFASSTVFAEVPFWKAKDKVYERIQNRDIIVSVKEAGTAKPPFQHRLEMNGAGRLEIPCAYAFKLSQDVVAIADESGYMEKSRYNRETQILSTRIAAYGLKADVETKIAADNSESSEPNLVFEILKGPMTGLKGQFTFFKVAAKKCDIGLSGDYHYDRFPVPQFFLRFGMEVMFQRMAARLRAYAERQYDRGP